MSDGVLFFLTLLSALGCGVIAGSFFAFSTFIMKALARLPPAQGIGAMQSINVVVINPWFMSALFGTALACAILAGSALFNFDRAGAVCRLTGGALYLVGTIGVTIACNVPRNNALAAVNAASDQGARVWTAYVAGWTAWNHVRTAAGLGAGLALMFALCE
jgi:uncharacterized membrane protein